MKTLIVIFALFAVALSIPCERPEVMNNCKKELKAVADAFKAKDPKFFEDMKKNIAADDFADCKAKYTGCEETKCEI